MVEHYQIGKNIVKHNPEHIAECIESMINDKEKMQLWKDNAKKAAQELNWEREKHVIAALF